MSWRVKTGPSPMAITSLMRTWLDARGQRGREVAHLVGVGKDDVAGLLGLNELVERDGVSVGGVAIQQRMLDARDFGDGFGCGFGGQRLGRTADDRGVQRLAGELGQTLGRLLRASQLARPMRPSRSSRTTQIPLIARAPRT